MGIRTYVALALLAGLILYVDPAAAAPKHREVTGTIELSDSTALGDIAPSVPAEPTPAVAYGESVEFAVTISGTPEKGSRLYVTVVCDQGDGAVYHISHFLDADMSVEPFELTDTGLGWDATRDADCLAYVGYRTARGRNITVTVLDQVEFVAGAQTPA